jgi:S1-C subfamily serine protease
LAGQGPQAAARAPQVSTLEWAQRRFAPHSQHRRCDEEPIDGCDFLRVFAMKRAVSTLAAAALGVVLVGMAANFSSGLAPQPLEAVVAGRPGPPPSPLGLRVVALDADAARALGVGGGVLVVHVIGQAYESGLRVDDVITEVNGRAVTGFEPFWDAVAAANWQPTLLVLRQGQALTIRIAAEQPVRTP